MTKHKLIFSFPDPKLNPNKRFNRLSLTKARQSQFSEGFYKGLKHRRHMAGYQLNIAITIVFFPPDNRQRDLDNLLSNIKSLGDGLAQGMGINDKQFRPITIDLGEADKKQPRTEISWEV